MNDLILKIKEAVDDLKSSLLNKPKPRRNNRQRAIRERRTGRNAYRTESTSENLLKKFKENKKAIIIIAAVVLFIGLIGIYNLMQYMDLRARNYCIMKLSPDSSYYIVVGYEGDKTTIEIPAEYKGKPVKSIGAWAFDHVQHEVTSIIIPDSVTRIGEGAFEWKIHLTDVIIGSSVVDIGNYAFRECSSLKNVTFNNNNSLENIGNEAFYHTQIEEIDIPDTVKSIGWCAFAHCTSLKEIALPEQAENFGGSTFVGCLSLTKVKIPSTYTSVPDSVFINCTGLTDVYISNSVKQIGSHAFEGCTSLKNVVFEENSQLETIGWGAFTNTPIESIELPNSVKTIRNEAFKDCTLLTNIVIPDSVTTIQERAFMGCTSLTSIAIPDSVTVLKDGLFSDCTSLTSVTLPNNLNGISGTMFNGCSALTSIALPNSITYIAYNSFHGCTSLESIFIPESVTDIYDHAFTNCDNLTIYCAATSKPKDWTNKWNSSNNPVVWGYIPE